MNGPTTVPCLVSTASTATGRWLIRFITLTSWPAMSGRCRFQSASDEMKNVVLPESPYGVWMTRSEPSPARPAAVASSAQSATVVSTFGTLATPTSLPSRVVTSLESRWLRSCADGRIRS